MKSVSTVGYKFRILDKISTCVIVDKLFSYMSNFAINNYKIKVPKQRKIKPFYISKCISFVNIYIYHGTSFKNRKLEFFNKSRIV